MNFCFSERIYGLMLFLFKGSGKPADGFRAIWLPRYPHEDKSRPAPTVSVLYASYDPKLPGRSHSSFLKCNIRLCQNYDLYRFKLYNIQPLFDAVASSRATIVVPKYSHIDATASNYWSL